MTHIQLRRQFRALHGDENLRHFVIEARSTGRTLGIGAYGAVEEVPLTLFSYSECKHSVTNMTNF